ncbi:hypothetical protein AB0I10_12560 [Streptomyces sp. NPDC050636]|uniref:hypothetical protein n=1 Tax=Streptomyces sp. NPDC050636 TaxID=3154510 RepID=UPI0034193F71
MIDPRLALIAALRDFRPGTAPVTCVYLADGLIMRLAEDGVVLVNVPPREPHAEL